MAVEKPTIGGGLITQIMQVNTTGMYSLRVLLGKTGYAQVVCSNVDDQLDYGKIINFQYYNETQLDITPTLQSSTGNIKDYRIEFPENQLDEAVYSLDGGNHTIYIAYQINTEFASPTYIYNSGFVVIPKDQTSRTVFDYGGNDVSAIAFNASTASEQVFYNAGLMRQKGPDDYKWPTDHVPQKIVFGTELTGIASHCIANGMNSAGSNIHELVIPASIMSIGSYAFTGTGLSSVTFIGRTLSEIYALDTNSNFFSLPSGCIIHGTNGSQTVSSGSGGASL